MIDDDLKRVTAVTGIWPRLLKNAGWLLGSRALNAPMALLESVLLARFLGVAGYGTLGLVMVTVTVLQRLLSFRMNEFTVRYLSKFGTNPGNREAGAALKFALLAEACSAAAACAIAYLSAPWLAKTFLSSEEPAGLIRLFAFMALANAFVETSAGALQVFDRFRFLAGTNVLRKVVTVTGLVVSLMLGGREASALLVYLLAGLLANAVVLAHLWSVAKERLGPRWWAVPIGQVRSAWREMAHFALSTNLSATLSLIIKDSDLLWIGFFSSPVEAGYLKLATTFLKVPFAAGAPITKAFYPEAANLASSGSAASIRKFLKQSTLVSAAWVVPVALATGLLAPFLIRLLYGEAFLPTLPALWILLVGLSMASIFFWTRPTLLALGRPEIPLKIAFVNAILKTGLALAFVPAWGYLGLSAILSGLHLNGLVLGVTAVKRALAKHETDGRPT